jgi:hypothetical protein
VRLKHAGAVGIQHRVLIEARRLPGHLIAAGHRFGRDGNERTELAGEDRSAECGQLDAVRIANRVYVVVVPDLNEDRRSGRFDDSAGRDNDRRRVVRASRLVCRAAAGSRLKQEAEVRVAVVEHAGSLPRQIHRLVS